MPPPPSCTRRGVASTQARERRQSAASRVAARPRGGTRRWARRLFAAPRGFRRGGRMGPASTARLWGHRAQEPRTREGASAGHARDAPARTVRVSVSPWRICAEGGTHHAHGENGSCSPASCGGVRGALDRASSRERGPVELGMAVKWWHPRQRMTRACADAFAHAAHLLAGVHAQATWARRACRSASRQLTNPRGCSKLPRGVSTSTAIQLSLHRRFRGRRRCRPEQDRCQQVAAGAT